VHRKMHIFDVVSSVSRSSKCTKIVGGWGFAQTPVGGDLQHSLDPLAGFKGPTSKALTSKGRGEEWAEGGCQNDLAAGRQKHLHRL